LLETSLADHPGDRSWHARRPSESRSAFYPLAVRLLSVAYESITWPLTALGSRELMQCFFVDAPEQTETQHRFGGCLGQESLGVSPRVGGFERILGSPSLATRRRNRPNKAGAPAAKDHIKRAELRSIMQRIVASAILCTLVTFKRGSALSVHVGSIFDDLASFDPVQSPKPDA